MMEVTPAAAVRTRLETIDLIRGAIMILMALDHTRDFLGVAGNPTNLATASAGLFLTRWVTHFCAPGFFFLMGTSAWLAGRRRTRAELSRFLLARGLWLVFLELVVLRCFSYQFNFDYRVTVLIVIWALGCALIALSGLVWLPLAAIATIGAVMVVGHNALDGIRSASPIWTILHRPGFVVNTPRFTIFTAYPLIPWLGVTALGYGLGPIYSWTPERRRRWLLRAGLAITAAFFLVRGIDGYGDPAPWAHQRTALFTVLSFLNATKYPPSLVFLLMTLGPVLLALAWAEGKPLARFRPIVTYGRVPLFYFALHFTLLHVFATIVAAVRYGAVHWLFESPDMGSYPFTSPPGWGFSLPGVYLAWMLVVLACYPLCRWFAGVKAARTSPWLSYL